MFYNLGPRLAAKGVLFVTRLFMKSLNKTDSASFVYLMYCALRIFLFTIHLFSLQVVLNAVSPGYHFSLVYIFWFFWITDGIWIYLNIEYSIVG